MVDKCYEESRVVQETYNKQTLTASEVLRKQQEDIFAVATPLLQLMNESPYLFQKCSMHTLMMINRCLSCIREDSSILCESEMNSYMELLREHIVKQHFEQDANKSGEDQNEMLKDKDATIKALQADLKAKDRALTAKDAQLIAKEDALKAKDDSLKEKDVELI